MVDPSVAKKEMGEKMEVHGDHHEDGGSYERGVRDCGLEETGGEV